MGREKIEVCAIFFKHSKKNQLSLITEILILPFFFSFFKKVGEDFRTALQRAHKCFVELDLVARSRLRLTSGTPSGSSSSDLHSSETFEMDRNRVDIMNRIVDILQHNLRVRYELKIADVLKSYVNFVYRFIDYTNTVGFTWAGVGF